MGDAEIALAAASKAASVVNMTNLQAQVAQVALRRQAESVTFSMGCTGSLDLRY
jgi:hypothetical protein